MQPGQGDGFRVSTVAVSRTLNSPVPSCSLPRHTNTPLGSALCLRPVSFRSRDLQATAVVLLLLFLPFVHKIITCTGFYDLFRERPDNTSVSLVKVRNLLRLKTKPCPSFQKSAQCRQHSPPPLSPQISHIYASS